jgi:hypothetical protein
VDSPRVAVPRLQGGSLPNGRRLVAASVAVVAL